MSNASLLNSKKSRTNLSKISSPPDGRSAILLLKMKEKLSKIKSRTALIRLLKILTSTRSRKIR